ncbi:hypothetical protein D9623_02550 [Azospirillum brasilense]|uniref:Magnesium chelatase ChlI-like catalytic domain-containing protein n=1 Tax=Azospirillum brasilense TaxID=192 RepID=A0A4D8QPW0_AZOBR|nr:hypothetical protein D3868_07580 [Azospirillum brasilense]QEL89109.1 hypothetical protein D9621_02545 [Azospirillum brasilense]QEL95358.1 hypothetical protein D9623_02550 [Azospirillum brasilense]
MLGWPQVRRTSPRPSAASCPAWLNGRRGTLDVQHVPGAKSAKRALEVAATGGHRIALPGETPQDDAIARHLVAAFATGVPGANVVAPTRGRRDGGLFCMPNIDLLCRFPRRSRAR